MHVLEVKGLSKSFDKIKAVDDVSFFVPEGSVFGLIGRNGAGKTTTIRMMMNIYEPDSGKVTLRGAPVTNEFKQKVGYLPEERGLYKKMNVWDTLMFFARVKGKKGKEIEEKANEYLKKFQLFTRKTSKIQDLSKGNQQKIQFIATILHDPEFLILDEPFSGLDPINTDLLREIIIDLKNQGKVIIFSTHLMDFAEKMCDHIAMIDEGKIILHGSLKEIKTKYGHRNVNITYDGSISFLNGHPIIESIQDFGNTTGITVKEESQTQELLQLLLERDVKVRRFNANDISLHDVFVKLAGDKDMEVANV
ncbi:MAG TPA: ATP-binding cassette domain-containing protein [Ignavibacteriaceae bacterium]|nr:ATP-binding cassette domain-containing protein [Ignavibacteriaceae bacterium]